MFLNFLFSYLQPRIGYVSIEGVFSAPIVEDFANPNFKEIKLNKKYILVLSKQISYGRTKIENIYQTIIDNDFLIWQTGMKSKYFTDCQNIVGNKINTRLWAEASPRYITS